MQEIEEIFKQKAPKSTFRNKYLGSIQLKIHWTTTAAAGEAIAISEKSRFAAAASENFPPTL